ncbi:MAG: hypothetical protein Q7T62_00495 [Undibacterium sp.]|nr:hypothetical protein [Undibacterium sp.]
MSKLFTKTFAFALFAIFMVNTLAWSVDTRRVSHDLEHSREFAHAASQTVPVHEHEHEHERATTVLDDDDVPSVMEHQLLHAVDHFQLFPSTLSYALPLSLTEAICPHFISHRLPMAALAPPFRPPRINTSLV